MPATYSAMQYPSPVNVAWPVDTMIAISFIKDPSKFKLNEYMQYIPVDGIRYKWRLLGRDASVRVPNTDEMVWEPGSDRSTRGNDKGTPFSEQTGRCITRDEAENVPWETEKRSPHWDILTTAIRRNASVMMTCRTLLVHAALANGNWLGNTGTSNSLNSNAGSWSQSSNDPNSPRYLAIAKALTQAALNITMLTNGEVDISDLRLLIQPADARVMALAPEVRDILNHTTMAGQVLSPDQKTMISRWGLPDQVAGIPIIVENAVYVSGNAPASVTPATEATINVNRKFIMPAGTAYLLSRPGGLEGAPGSQSFSTIQIFHPKDSPLLEAQQFPDIENERTKTHCKECIDIQLAAPMAGYQITGIMA